MPIPDRCCDTDHTPSVYTKPRNEHEGPPKLHPIPVEPSREHRNPIQLLEGPPHGPEVAELYPPGEPRLAQGSEVG